MGVRVGVGVEVGVGVGVGVGVEVRVGVGVGLKVGMGEQPRARAGPGQLAYKFLCKSYFWLNKVAAVEVELAGVKEVVVGAPGVVVAVV